METLSSILTFIRRALPWVLLFVGVFWVSTVMRPTGVFHVGQHLPKFSAQLVDGTRFDMPEKPGHPMVVNFWATYCAPCRDEAPLLSAAAQHGVSVVGLSVETDATRETLASAAKSFGMTYPVALGDGALVKQFQIHTVPTTYVLAADGAIVLSRVGKLGKAELDEALALAEKAAAH